MTIITCHTVTLEDIFIHTIHTMPVYYLQCYPGIYPDIIHVILQRYVMKVVIQLMVYVLGG